MNSSIICTVDVVLLTLKSASLHVALLRREREPFAGTWALPGGYVHAQEDRDTQDAAERVLREKAHVQSPYLEQLATFSGPARDPRGWSLSVVYYALVSEEVLSHGLSPELQLVNVDGLKGLPFDHQAVIEAAVARVRSKSVYSSLPVHLCPSEFTLPQLQSVYEALLGEPVNKVSFRRKVAELGVLEEVVGAKEEGKPYRPAQLYRLKPEFRKTLSTTDRGINAG